ncbi:MAG: protease modulator HflK [Thermoanaerobaculia bacterium]|nr:protease modulator HflK [Thermoanaerobaculia bacterium]
MADPTLEIHKQDLARLRRVTGWVTLTGSWLFGATSLGVGLWFGMRVPIAIGLFFLLQAAVLTGFWITLRWRQEAFAIRLEDPTASIRGVPVVVRTLPYLAGVLAITLPFYSDWAPLVADAWAAFDPWARLRELDSDAAETQVFAWGLVVVATLSALFAQYFATISRELAPEARGAACWFRAGTWMALAGAVSLFVRAFDKPWEEGLTTSILLGIVVFLGGELTLRALWTTWSSFYSREPHPGGRVATDLFSLELLCSRFNPLGSLFDVLAEAFGIDLRGAWALTFMRRALAPLAGGLLVVGWLSTSFVVVEGSDVGLVERFGKLDREPLRPGLHFVLPWPMHRVTRVPVHRVQTIPIGFTGAREDASMLWTVEHAEEEYKLLLGDGRDLVTVNASLHYRIGDPFAYAYSLQNPDETLAILADRVLMQRTVGRSLDGVLSENLAAFGAELEQAIQGASDERNLGFEIVDLTLVGLHPPVSVAADYQAVVAARVDQTTKVLEAEAYHERERPKADGKVADLENGAHAHRVTRLATALGEATAFQALRASYVADPELFALVRYLQSVEAQLTGKKFHVIDHTIEEAGGAIWLLE